MTGTIVDGVHRFPETGANIIIIGAGVGGLQAAIECWRKGFDVVVLEAVKELSPQGDFFTITPSALTTLKDYPSMYADYHRSVHDCSIHLYSSSGCEIHRKMPEWKQPGVITAAPDVNISFLNRRPEYTQMQADQAKRLNIPIHWGDKVTTVDETDGGVVVKTASGKEFRGDVCVVATGIGSSVKGFNAGLDNAVQDSGYAIARAAFPRNAIKEGSPASALLKNIDSRPEFRVYLGNDLHLILFLTPDWVAFALTHPDFDNAQESWSNLKDPAELVTYLEKANEHWDPAVLDFIRSCTRGAVDWKLRWRDGTKQWVSDRGCVVRLGDAAHAFLPTAGNGAVQALEDAVSLAECLCIAGKQNTTQATKVHNRLRFERVSILQQTGFLNREELHHANITAITADRRNADIGFFKIGRWVWNHNPEIYARENYQACLASMIGETSFDNTNIPPGHVYQPWNLDSETKRMVAGIKSNLKQNGDWSV